MGKSSPAPPRSRPNILITGTPGTGKSSLAERVAAAAGFTQYDVSAVAKQEKLCAEYDEELDTYVIDEDKAGRRGAHSVPVRVRGFKV
jgi:adenylate kinase